MRLNDHRLSLRIDRSPLDTGSFAELPRPSSSVDIDVSSSDLKLAWDELLQRLPSDTYKALFDAMRERYDDEGIFNAKDDDTSLAREASGHDQQSAPADRR